VATLMKLKFYFLQTTDITWSIDKKGWVGVKLSYVLPTTKGVQSEPQRSWKFHRQRNENSF